MKRRHWLLPHLLAISVVSSVLVYLLDLPTFMSGETELVREYYYDNFETSFLLDIVLIAAYVHLAEYVMKIVGAQGLYARTFIVGCTAALISSLFLISFSAGWRPGSFFSRWFRAVGTVAVAYDAVVVTAVYMVSEWLQRRIASRIA